MATADASIPSAIESASPPRALRWRLMPPVILVALYWLGRVVVNTFLAGTFPQFLTLFWSPILLALGVLIWWLFFSRMAWIDRLWGVACLVAGGGLTTLLADKSMVPMGVIMYATPVVITASIGWLLFLRGRSDWTARLSLLAVAMLVWHCYALIRVDGITGGFATQWSFRWQPTAEDEYLASLVPAGRAEADESKLAAEALVATAADWPGFRGPQRDGVLRGVKLDRDWDQQPPNELWRRRVGPGWSSFAAIGDVAFTQEQRGEKEAVVCFDVATGREIWVHEDSTRFWEVVAGAGPRATPTFDSGQLYTLGGSGRLNCLDAATGRSIWSRHMAADAGCTSPPPWGFACSPLVTQGTVIVLAGMDGKAALGYDAQTGELKWTAGQGKHTYSSPHVWTLDGAEQVLLVSDFGLEALDPATGQELWSHQWTLQGIFRVVQPGIVEPGRVLIGTGMGNGTRLLTVRGGGSEWEVSEEWTTRDMKPYFNDYVVHEGYLYGFDHDLFACIDLESGKREWKRGRYGQGQVLLVADCDVLLVVSEQGEVVLLEANPEDHVELGRFQALAGKTWNHPVIHNGKLLVRNGEEMACYELAVEE